MDGNSTVVVLDTGHLHVESHLADKDAAKGVKFRFSDEELARLTNLLYDRFTIEMTSVQVCADFICIGTRRKFQTLLHGKAPIH